MASTTTKTYYLVEFNDSIEPTKRITINCKTERGAKQIARDVHDYVIDLQIWRCEEESPVTFKTRIYSMTPDA